MGILGRFDRRKARDRIRLKHHLYPAKHRIATRTQSVSTPAKYCTSTSSPQKAPSQFPKIASVALKDAKHSLNDKNGPLGFIIHVEDGTATIIRNEVADILNSSSDHSCTILEMANALAQSQACLESHSKIHGKHYRYFANTSVRKLRQNEKIAVDWAGNPKTKSSLTQHQRREPFKFLGRFNILPRRTEKESMRSRYQWVDALNRLEKFPSSRDQTISTWEEAKKSLEKVICFPHPLLSSEESRRDQDVESSRIQNLSSEEKERRENLEAELEIVQENVNTLSVSNGKWKQIASYPSQHRFNSKVKKGYERDEEEDLETLIQKECIDKADLYFNARIRTAEELENRLRGSEAVKKLEERRISIEARKRASLLMRTLNDDERKIVETAIHGFGHGDEIVAQAGTDSVQRASMKTLKPGMWLNDEIIHYFYLMLAKRDEELCKNDPSRNRSHFFKSFFITKLLNEGNASCDGKYEYRNVKRWSKKVPGKDIFNLDKILFPINMGNMHWICAAIFMKKKRIEIFDSMGSNGNRYLDALFNYIQDEHMDKKKTPLPDTDSWHLVPTQRDTPRQTNGTFVLKFGCIHCVIGEAS
jgi:sentrin-specific protease 1